MSSTRGPYNCLKVIGAGAFGKVFQAQHSDTGVVVALKVIDLDNGDDEDIALIQKEVAVLSQLSNVPNITKYYGSFLSGTEVCIAMEYASAGSVYDLMQSIPNRCLDEKPAALITREILVALAALHAVPVIHRDIKCANILVGKNGGVMLCDFGVSALLQGASNRRDTWIGSPYWMAPEIVSGASSYDSKVDVWSLGVSLYEMIKGSPPLAHLGPEEVLKRIPTSQPPRLGEEDSSLLLRTFLASCLKEYPEERSTADALLKTKWIKLIAKVPISMLRELIPSARQSLAGIEAQNDSESPTQLTDRPESWSFGGYDDEPLRADLGTIRPHAAPLPRSLKGLFNDLNDPESTSSMQTSDDFPSDEAYNISLGPPSFPPHPSSSRPPSFRSGTPIVDSFHDESSPPTPVAITIALPPMPAAFQNFVPTPPDSPPQPAPPIELTITKPLTPEPFIRRAPSSNSILPPTYDSEASKTAYRKQVVPREPPSSSASESTPRSRANTSADSKPYWKFPSAPTPAEVTVNRTQKLSNLSLGLTPSLARAQELGVPDLLPPSPIPQTKKTYLPSIEDSFSPLPQPSAQAPPPPPPSLPIPSLNYAALLSDPSITRSELERTVKDLCAVLQGMSEGLNGLLGDDPAGGHSPYHAIVEESAGAEGEEVGY